MERNTLYKYSVVYHNPLQGESNSLSLLRGVVDYQTFRKETSTVEFFINMIPPTVTAQEHKVTMLRGRPKFYDTPRLKAARTLYERTLQQYRPEIPLEGALALTVEWWFPSRTHREGELRITRPDTDNLQKLLKDCMTHVGFWKDDAQVCQELVIKRWTRSRPGLRIEVTQIHE